MHVGLAGPVLILSGVKFAGGREAGDSLLEQRVAGHGRQDKGIEVLRHGSREPADAVARDDDGRYAVDTGVALEHQYAPALGTEGVELVAMGCGRVAGNVLIDGAADDEDGGVAPGIVGNPLADHPPGLLNARWLQHAEGSGGLACKGEDAFGGIVVVVVVAKAVGRHKKGHAGLLLRRVNGIIGAARREKKREK